MSDHPGVRAHEPGFVDDASLARDERTQTPAAIAVSHVDAIGAKIAELEAMRRTLERLISACHGDDRPDCPILDDMAGASTATGSKRKPTMA